MRTLVVVDEYTRECLVARVGRRLNSEDVIDVLADLFVRRGTPEYLRSDNGSEFAAKQVRQWLEALLVSRRSSLRREVRGRTAISSP